MRRNDLHGRIQALLDLWKDSQRATERQAEQRRFASDGEWLTGVEDRGRTMIEQLEDVLRGRIPPGMDTRQENEPPTELPEYDPASEGP